MATTAGAVLQQAADLLNDPSQRFWTDAVLLPMLKIANQNLGSLLRENGVSVNKDISITIDVDVDDTELDEYPTDFFLPLFLWERVQGSSEKWKKVTESKNGWIDKNLLVEPTIESIVQWVFRDNKIFINPPQTAREVQLNYIRQFTAIIDDTTTLEINESITYLAARTAQLAANNIGNNPTKGESLRINEVESSEHRLINAYVKNQQAQTTRRRPYKGAR